MSAKTSDRVVLDAHAVLTFLQGEPGEQRVSDILTGGEPWMTLVNLGEVTYVLECERGKATADTVYANLLSQEQPGGGAAIRWLPVDEVLVRKAASLKAAGGLSYADAFAAAAAGILNCPVLTGDPEFAAAERAGVAIEWL